MLGRKRTHHPAVLAGLIGALAAASATAQPGQGENADGASSPDGMLSTPAAAGQQGPPPGRPRFRVSTQAGASYSSPADTDPAGDVSVFRAFADVSFEYDVAQQATLIASIDNETSFYDFEGAGAWAGGDATPIDDALFDSGVNIGGRYLFNRQWAAFGLALFSFSGASEADAGDSFSAGGVLGIRHQLNRDLAITGGMIVIDQLEEDEVLIVPIVGIEWQINERLRLDTLPSVTSRGIGGEVRYQINDAFDIGLYGRFQPRQFRLADDDAFAPGGLLTDNRVLIGTGLTWRGGRGIEAGLGLGVAIPTTFEILDSNDVELIDLDPDPSVAVGFGVRIPL